MLTKTEYQQAQARAAQLLRRTGLALRDAELATIAVADFGLSELAETGAQILTLLDTEAIAVKLIVLFSDQTLPEHRHPPLGDYPGKAETLRCEWGTAYLYTYAPAAQPPGRSDAAPTNPSGCSPAGPPAHRRDTYTAWHQTVLQPGEQATLPPNTRHWFQAGSQGCVVWSFSSRAVDVQDIFTDPEIERITTITDNP